MELQVTQKEQRQTVELHHFLTAFGDAVAACNSNDSNAASHTKVACYIPACATAEHIVNDKNGVPLVDPIAIGGQQCRGGFGELERCTGACRTSTTNQPASRNMQSSIGKAVATTRAVDSSAVDGRGAKQ
jgi:hypothetical protein